ncbi:hypothetical protein [Mesorhizobium sp. B1-1-6]|uniref:hypothetical protein n=1 Tax=Mesorhizobium sp. B1-1-6 TaxID=2589978 RepID=UPI0011280125|nr:hypothetical protein [Mesorhizobium sp. B1-1-6]TPN41385.1 hypothetical protein FJ979_04515 [Mesorhizobium sp. B1-1-6]
MSDDPFAPLGDELARRKLDPISEAEWAPMLPVPANAPNLTNALIERLGPEGASLTVSWAYRDAEGRLLGQIARYDRPVNGAKPTKEFRPFTYCQRQGRREWRCKGFPEPRPLYGLDRLAGRPNAPVIVTEGEKKAEAANKLFPDHVAVSPPNGSKSAKKADWSPLANRSVTIWPDADAPGAAFAGDAAEMLRQSGAASVRLVKLMEGLPVGWDLADALPEGVEYGDLAAILAEAEEVRQPDAEPDTESAGRNAEREEPKASAATVLVKIAEELYDLGISVEGEPFGVPRSGAKVVQMLRGGKMSLRSQLSREYFRRTRRAAPQQALADALLVLEGIAQENEPQVLHIRVARCAEAQWLDLGDGTGRAVVVTSDGWSVEDHVPVLFKRTEVTAALPEPVRGGSLDELWDWLNVPDEDKPLVAAWLVAALYFDIPHPILSLGGEQGAGKSSFSGVLTRLIDPSPVPLRKPPRDVEAWVTAASGSWVVGLDNLSVVPDWLSDALCRAVTGDGDVRRRLYTDGGLYVFAFRRCVILNGIDLGAIRGDLADRLLSIDLRVIPDDERLNETDLWPKWDAVHPRLLGALLDLTAGVKRILPSVRLDRKPRMADFADILAAVDRLLGTRGLDRYLSKQGSLAADTLTADPFIMAVAVLGKEFEGTAALLLEVVTKPEKLPKGWPANARLTTVHLKRQAPVMRKAGWHIENDEGRNKDGVVTWTIRPPEKAGISVPPSPPSPPSVSVAGQAGQAGQENGPSQDDKAYHGY